MNGRQAARMASKRIDELEVVCAMQAKDIRDYNKVILDMISGESPCAYCEDYSECQREVKAGEGCSEWWLRYERVTQADVKEDDNAGERVHAPSAEG